MLFRCLLCFYFSQLKITAEAEIKRHLRTREPKNFTGLETLNGASLHPRYLLNSPFLSNPWIKISIGVAVFYSAFFTTDPKFFFLYLFLPVNRIFKDFRDVQPVFKRKDAEASFTATLWVQNTLEAGLHRPALSK